MKKIVITLVLILFSFEMLVYAQGINNTMLSEKVFVHYNTTLLMSGETLYYKLYCIRPNHNRLSNLSKVAYVDLIDSEKNIVFSHKIRLKSGVGHGEFVIPKTVSTGNFKIVAYTQWMRNDTASNFFQGDLAIINTFKDYQNLNIANQDLTNDLTTPKLNSAPNTITDDADASVSTDGIGIVLDAKAYNKRDQVKFNVAGLDNENEMGNYSISVRKIDDVKPSKRLTFQNFYKDYIDSGVIKSSLTSSSTFMPEFKGGVLKGTVLTKDSNTPMEGVKVLLSSPNGKYPIRFATTNASGVFEFIFKIKREEQKSILQVLDANREHYKIVVSNLVTMDYNNIEIDNFELPQNMLDQLKAYNIYNQIEDAYVSRKSNVQGEINTNEDARAEQGETFMLDDYTRFSTVKETIIEIVNHVSVVKKKRKYNFYVRSNDMNEKEENLPLVFLDGVLIQDHNSFADYNARTLKSIHVIRDKFSYKSFVFQGVIAMESRSSEAKHTYIVDDHISYLNLFRTQNNNGFYEQVYNDDTFDRIPDYRRQLHWVPNMQITAKNNNVVFYTSDIHGDFEICLEGFNAKGQPVTIKERFSVN